MGLWCTIDDEYYAICCLVFLHTGHIRFWQRNISMQGVSVAFIQWWKTISCCVLWHYERPCAATVQLWNHWSTKGRYAVALQCTLQHHAVRVGCSLFNFIIDYPIWYFFILTLSLHLQKSFKIDEIWQYPLFLNFRHSETGIYASSGRERVLMFLPMYHMFGIMVMLTALADGNTLVLMPKYDIRNFIKTIKQYKVWCLNCSIIRLSPSKTIFNEIA